MDKNKSMEETNAFPIMVGALEIDHLSHSSLNALRVSPMYFRKYKENELNELDSRSLSIGNAIHCYILRGTDFNSEYCVSDIDPPGGMMGKFIETLVAIINNDCEDVSKDTPLEEAYIIAHEIAGFKTKLETVIKNFEKPENKEYYDFLNSNYGLTALSSKEMQVVSKCHHSIMYHRVANDLLVNNPLDNRLTFNELEINWTNKESIFATPNVEFTIKSIIDRLVVDMDKNIVYIVDLKTTSSGVYNFEGSYKKYGYYRQLALYREAAYHHLKNIGINVDDFAFKTYIIAVQTTGLQECVIYEPSFEDLALGTREIKDLMDRLVWHVENNTWDYPKEYYQTDGVVTINISNNESENKKEELG